MYKVINPKTNEQYGIDCLSEEEAWCLQVEHEGSEIICIEPINLKIYKVILNIDTGSDWYDKVCILYANDENEARKNASQYVNRHLHGDMCANVKSVVELNTEDNIIYQDCFIISWIVNLIGGKNYEERRF